MNRLVPVIRSDAVVWPTASATCAGAVLLALTGLIFSLRQINFLGWHGEPAWTVVYFAQATGLTLLLLSLPGWHLRVGSAPLALTGLFLVGAGLLTWALSVMPTFTATGALPFPVVFWLQPWSYPALIAVGSPLLAWQLWRAHALDLVGAAVMAITAPLSMLLIGGRSWLGMLTNATIDWPDVAGPSYSFIVLGLWIAWASAGLRLITTHGAHSTGHQQVDDTPATFQTRRSLATSARRSRRIGLVAVGVVGLNAVLLLSALALRLLNQTAGQLMGVPWLAEDATAAVVFPIVGGIIAWRRPGNLIGWLLCAVGLIGALDASAIEYAGASLVTSRGALPGGQVAEWLTTWTWIVTSFLAPFLLLLFPDGRLPKGRIWLGVGWLLGLGAGMAVVFVAAAEGPMAGFSPGVPELANPIGLLRPGPIMRLVQLLSAWLYIAGTLLGLLVLVHRFSVGTDEERQQIKWIVVGAVITAPVLLASTFLGAGRGSVGGQVLVCVAEAVLPVAIGLAVVRYKLYAIDLILNRAAVYGILTLVLGTAFLALTALSQTALQVSTGQRSDLLPVGVGLGVAMTFQPVRRRAQGLVDRILPAREERALFFTDIVGSTERLAELGDARWRVLLDQYRATVRREVRRHGGTEMHVAGDSFFVTFGDPLRAVRCAQALAPALRGLGLESRFGVHWGPCEVRGEEVSGLSVWAAARVMSTAGPSEIVLSEPLCQALQHEGLPLEDRGTHRLKGLPGEWRLHALPSATSS